MQHRVVISLTFESKQEAGNDVNELRREARALQEAWPAAGFVDTEIGCFMKPEVAYAATTVWA